MDVTIKEIDMQKWEYKWIEIPHSLEMMKIVMEDTGKKQKVEALDHVNSLGESGWELVGIEQKTPGGAYSPYILFFKRPE